MHKSFGAFWAFLYIFFFSAILTFGAENASPSFLLEIPEKAETITVSGLVRQERSERRFRKWMRDMVLVIVTPEESFTLLRGRDKRVVARIEEQIGKSIVVQGEVVPASRRHSRRGLKVFSFSPKAEEKPDLSILPGPTSPKK